LLWPHGCGRKIVAGDLLDEQMVEVHQKHCTGKA